MNKAILLAGLLTWSIIGCAQYLRFEGNVGFYNYSHQAGLPSTQIFQIAQAPTGVIWFGTRLGLCRYNGNEFDFWGVRDGLPGNSIYHLYPDQDRVWLDTRNDFGYWENDAYTTFIPGSRESFNNMIFGDDGVKYCSTSKGIYRIEGDSLIKLEINIQSNRGMRIEMVEKDGTIWINRGNRLIRHRNGDIKEVVKLGERGRFGDRSFLIRDENDSLLYTTNRGIWKIRETGAVEVYPEIKELLKESGLTSALIDRDGNFWLGSFSGGVYFIEKSADNTSQIRRLFAGLEIGNIFEDRDRNIWIGTSGDGVFMLSYRAREVQNYPIDDPASKAPSLKMRNAIRTASGSTWSYEGNKILFNTAGRTIEIMGLDNIQNMVAGEENDVYACSMRGVFHFPEEEVRTFYRNNPEPTREQLFEAFQITPERTRRVSFDPTTESIWYYSQQGMQRWKDNKIENTLLMNNDTLKWYISDIVSVPGEDKLWLSSFGRGLILLSPDTLVAFSTNDGLNSDNNNRLAIDEEGNLWVFGLNGISKLVNIDYDDFSFNVFSLREQDGMIDGDIEEGLVTSDSVYVRTNKGFSVFSRDLITKQPLAEPGIEFTGIRIEGLNLPVQESYRLKYHENDLNINFTGICYNNNDLISFRYRMVGVDEDWQRTSSRGLQYSNLSPGEYTFEVLAEDIYGQEAVQPVQMTFQIVPAFWQVPFYRFLFFLLIAALGALMIWQYARFRNRQREEQLVLERQIAESEQRALRAQMNPHFVYNVMNSIQQFIIKKDTLQALDYLSDFGMLIRKSFEYSSELSISLEDELEFLKLYLMLEKMRFDDNLEFNIRVDETIDLANTYVPSLFLQPFAENSIRHGLRHQEGVGKIDVNIKKTGDDITCAIEDNGVGIERSKQMESWKPDAFRTSGMEITRNRLELFNRLSSKPLDMEVIDLGEAGLADSGTRVTLTIPILLGDDKPEEHARSKPTDQIGNRGGREEEQGVSKRATPKLFPSSGSSR